MSTPRDAISLHGRVGVIGDVHGEDLILEAALRHLRDVRAVETVLSTGDLPAKKGIGDTDRCCELLRDAGVLAIRGNHDRWCFENEGIRAVLGLEDIGLSADTRRYLSTLPPMRSFDTPSGALLLCHGAADDDMSGIYPGGDDREILDALARRHHLPGVYRWMIAGHTHRRMVRPLPGSFTIINPGALCWDEQPGFLILDFTKSTARFYDVAPFTGEVTPAERFGLTTPA